MSRLLLTRWDAVRHTLGRIAVAVLGAMALTLALSLVVFGRDPTATIEAGIVIQAALGISATIAAVLTGALSYRSAIMMKELALARAELWRLSRCDQLTGLLNRRGFDDAASPAIRTAASAGVCVTVLMCDIDRFKSINDRFGHEFGDHVLRELGNQMKSLIEAHDGVVARHGGEEFAVLLVGLELEGALSVAERLRKSCELNICRGRVCTDVSISIGLASSRGGTNVAEIMRAADSALYAAKRRGRNQVARAALVA